MKIEWLIHVVDPEFVHGRLVSVTVDDAKASQTIAALHEQGEEVLVTVAPHDCEYCTHCK